MNAKVLVMMVAGMLISGAAVAQSGPDLVKSKNCLACHDMEKKKMGPAFKDIAAKYSGNKEAEAKLVTALQTGKGHPSKVAATDDELKTMVQYVLSAK